jgi:hypothetical protein
MCNARSGGDELSMTGSVISPRKKSPVPVEDPMRG